MDAQTPAKDAIHVLAEAYCDAVHFARADVFADMCHDKFTMTHMGADGSAEFWDKPAYLARVSGRSAFEGAPVYEIFSIDVAGDEMARVHLRVDVLPHRYEDHLGFIRVDGAWKLMTKVFRTMNGPAMEG
jgi:hypothetical protein